MKCHVIKYGNHPDQFARLYRPTDAYDDNVSVPPHSHGPWPVVAIIHGGFWKQQYNIDNSHMDTLPFFFASHGYAVYMIEYRRVGPKCAGGWPQTNDDILTALRELRDQGGLDMDRVIILGHSAGGCLALWTCCKLEQRDLGFTPRLCVAIAPVANLEQGQRRGFSASGTAIADYMKHFPCSFGTHEVNNASCCGIYANTKNANQDPPLQCSEICQYKLASPSALLPVEVPLLLCSGTDDEIVPKDYVEEFHYKLMAVPDQSKVFVDFVVLRGADHFQVVDAKQPSWNIIFGKIEKNLF